jgi:hypothetical protein
VSLQVKPPGPTAASAVEESSSPGDEDEPHAVARESIERIRRGAVRRMETRSVARYGPGVNIRFDERTWATLSEN